MRLFILFILVFFIRSNSVVSQCTVYASNGSYQVDVEFFVSGVIFKNSCSNPSGYNYDVTIDYDIIFSGTSVPSSLYTLQGYVDCVTHSNYGMYFNLPNGGGTGTATTNGNPWVGNPAGCGSDTPTSLGCTQINLQINGPNISNQTISCPPINIALPITLNYFKAQSLDDEIHLQWETSSEQNCSHFTLERSLDGNNWTFLSEIAGSGNSSIPVLYNYTDTPTKSDETYYRLQQFDINGNSSVYYYTKVIYDAEQNGIPYPNPTDNTISINGDFSNSNIEIFNLLGQNITSSIDIIQNKAMAQMNMSHLVTGIYLIKIGTETYRIQKL